MDPFRLLHRGSALLGVYMDPFRLLHRGLAALPGVYIDPFQLLYRGLPTGCVNRPIQAVTVGAYC